VLGLAAFLLPVILSILLAGGAAAKRPIYVGSQVCGQCHDGQAQGNQFTLWRASKHAQGFACLALEQSKRIARLSGVPVEPEDSPICLGCHATASDTEAWEKEETFRLQDGVQCEFCHGPASEHVADQMSAKEHSSPAAPMRVPGAEVCATCHAEKGSHVAVLSSPLLDVPEGMKRIAHPRPAGAPRPEPRDWPQPPVAGNLPPSAPHYVGLEACAGCHHGARMGYQASRWRLSPHAQAYAVLGTPAGEEMARKDGITSDPTRTGHCLTCHTTAFTAPKEQREEGFLLEDGVQCEACHGPGSAYSPEAVMLDRQAARQAGLREVTEETCLTCHRSAHGRPFHYQEALSAIAHPTRPTTPTAEAREPTYKTPVNLALSPDGKELYVTCEAAGTVIVVDVAARRVVAEIPSGGQPHDVCFSPDGRLAYVTNRLDDSLAVIDTAQRKVVRTIPVGDEPHGVLTSPDGKTIFVLNTLSDSISAIDAESARETKRLAASRSPWSLALSPGGNSILVTNNLSRFVPFRTPSQSEVTVIDVGQAVVRDRYVLPAANLLQGVAWHPSGEFALITMNRTKNLVPMTRLLQGWTITNGVGIVWPGARPSAGSGRAELVEAREAGGRVDQVLLDEPDACFPDANDVAFTPDGRYALVTSGGSNRVAVIDVGKLTSLVRGASEYDRQHVLPNDLGKPTEFVLKHIATGVNPRGVLVLPSGELAFVADALDDSLTVIDLVRLEAAGTIDLGGPKEVTKVRAGQRIFFSAAKTFHQQFSCNSCHPDGHVDGLTYDIEPDGIGTAPVDNRTLRGVLDTAPFKWEGTNPSLKRQCGPRLAVFFTRIDPFNAEELDALDAYICTIPQPPNRYRGVGEKLTPAQRRGKDVFERTTTNDGRVIPEGNRCITCHPPPYFTDRRKHDVGTRMWLDHTGLFDTPQLNNTYDSAPYLHNGIAPTLEEIWTRFNPTDKHGVSNDMTKDQLNDLTEYLKTL
jgi:YVTN family beta-propeller protein